MLVWILNYQADTVNNFIYKTPYYSSFLNSAYIFCRSPWFSHITSSISGLSTIHAYQKTGDMIEKLVLFDSYNLRLEIKIKRLNLCKIFYDYRLNTVIIYIIFQLYFVNRHDQLLDINSQTYFGYLNATRWLSVRLDALTVCVTVVVSLFVVFSTIYPDVLGATSASFAGLALTYAIQVKIKI